MRLSRVQHAGIQMDVARALCSISAHPDNQVGVFGPPELEALFELALNTEENCGRDAAIAIGNLSTITKNQVTMVELGALKPLIALLESPFSSCQQFAARALCRLSAHTANQPKVVEAGGMQLLINACRSAEPEVRRFASMALCNVCVHEANKVKVVKLDGLRPLVRPSTTSTRPPPRTRTQPKITDNWNPPPRDARRRDPCRRGWGGGAVAARRSASMLHDGVIKPARGMKQQRKLAS